MVKVKICGITNLKDAMSAINAGCDALGFVFYSKSPRYVAPEKARRIIKNLPRRIIKIGVFVDCPERTVKKIARDCGLNLLQFHGSESPKYCDKFRKGYRVIKAFRVGSSITPGNILKYKTFAYLFDSYEKSKFGGTGKVFDWRLIEHPECVTRPIFISGGLNEDNVRKAVSILRPHWVDVSSGVEEKPGKKDHKKIKRFVRSAKSGS